MNHAAKEQQPEPSEALRECAIRCARGWASGEMSWDVAVRACMRQMEADRVVASELQRIAEGDRDG